ncbi:nitrilase-related carbon-nitrogen hydrolase [Archangium lansingense]|uniref:nitrilase-related carbon-nitrogen hydrolase n=1 Tax=Archangium lansingense TaxID=2995310 RepID=UPI003B7BFC8D
MSGRLSVALGQYDTGWHAPEASLAAAETLITRAAAGGARLVVLPEMATTGFTMDKTQATPLAGPVVSRLGELAARSGVWLVAGVAVREEDGADATAPCTVNTAIAFEPTGRVAAMHRKQRLFAYGGEHQHYRAGTTPTRLTIDGVRIALFICYELRFPELFGAVARDVDAMILIANWPAARRAHWDALLRARAIENQSYFVGVNRTGTAGGLTYDGGSAAFSPWGEELAPDTAPGVPLVTLEANKVAEIRERYPFLRDRAV